MGSGGLDEKRLHLLHERMEKAVAAGHLPGVVTALSRRGEVHLDAVGTTSVGGGRPMSSDTIFRIASMTKPITAVAAMILVEDCVLHLDDTVLDFLPELADRQVLTRIDGPLDDTVPARRALTVRDLLTFRLGFGLYFEPSPIQRAVEELQLGQGAPSPATTPEPDEWMRRFATLPLMHQPGEKWMYHTGSDLLGVLVARACGRPFETFLRERIFEPLGMSDTGFSVPESKRDRFTTSYEPDGSGGLDVFDEIDGQWSEPPAFPSGAAGLVSTAEDYLAFAQMLLHRGTRDDQRILSRPAIELMTTDQLLPQQKGDVFLSESVHTRGWGFGVSVVTGRPGVETTPGRFGWDGGLGTSWYSDPVEDLTGIVLTQRSFAPPEVHVLTDFWTLAYSAIQD